MTPWETWCAGVLKGISAPVDAINVDTLWAWSNAETAPYPLLRWNNPMNTTEPWPGSRDSGAQPGAHDVKIYASLQDGCDATAFTLVKEPYYGAIVANLRASKPRQQWGTTSAAGAQLHLWGTGTSWLNSAPYFGAPPTGLTGDEMIPDNQFYSLLQAIYGIQMNADGSAQKDAAGHPIPTPAMAMILKASTDQTTAIVNAINAAAAKPEPAEVEPASAPAITPQVAADLATVAGFLRKFGQ